METDRIFCSTSAGITTIEIKPFVIPTQEVICFYYIKYHIFRLIFLLMAFICCHPEERSDVRTSSFVFSHDSRITNHGLFTFYFFYLISFFSPCLSFYTSSTLLFFPSRLLPRYSFYFDPYLAIFLYFSYLACLSRYSIKKSVSETERARFPRCNLVRARLSSEG